MTFEDQKTLKQSLNRLRKQHEELDMTLNQLSSSPAINQLAIQRLKREKLLLKDRIEKVSSALLPDIIA